jgi:hypothetical protein
MPWHILSALKAIGFDEACDVTRACEAANVSIRMFLAEGKGPRPQISNSCPAVVRLLQVSYPELVHNIIPIEAPRETVSREAKNRISRERGVPIEEIGAIYITPCPAKMIAIREPAEEARSYLDGAIAISDVYGPLLSALSKPHEEPEDAGKDFSGIGVGWARIGGFCNAFESESCMSTAGISNVLEVLDDIEQGKLRDVDFVELFTCRGGCIGGSLTVENVYLSRSKVINLTKKFGEPKCDPDEIAAQYREGTQFLRGPVLPRPIKPLDKDVGKAIEKMKVKEQVYETLPKIDCGACGSPNCMAFAEDLVQGMVSESDCIFRMYEKLRGISEDLSRFIEKLAPAGGK